MALHPSHPIVSSLVFVVDPVEFLIGAVLKAVLGDPLISIAAALGQDPRHDLGVPQVNLQPLSVVLKLREPRTPAEGRWETGTSAADVGAVIQVVFISLGPNSEFLSPAWLL